MAMHYYSNSASPRHPRDSNCGIRLLTTNNTPTIKLEHGKMHLTTTPQSPTGLVFHVRLYQAPRSRSTINMVHDFLEPAHRTMVIFQFIQPYRVYIYALRVGDHLLHEARTLVTFFMLCKLVPTSHVNLWIWANPPIHLFLVGCLNSCLQGTSVRVGSPQP